MLQEQELLTRSYCELAQLRNVRMGESGTDELDQPGALDKII